MPWDGSGDSQPVWVHRQDQRGAYPTVSVSAALLDLSRGQAGTWGLVRVPKPR